MASIKAMLEEVVGSLVFNPLTVESSRLVSPHFQRLAFTGDWLRSGACSPGDKLQVMLPGVGSRTYTPFAFDAAAGRLELLVYLHANEPGAQWGRQARPGDRVRVFGPRGSLPIAKVARPVVLLGDETSFAVARTLVQADAGAADKVALIFEVSRPEESAAVLDDLGLAQRELVARREDGQHAAEVEERVRAALARLSADAAGCTLLLTGSAQSIQSLRAALKRRPVPGVTQKVKAYWSKGKRGLD